MCDYYPPFITFTGGKLLPDFFLDVDGSDAKKIMEAQKTADTVPQGNSAEGVDGIFDIIKSLCNNQLVNEVRGVFEFHLTGKDEGVWYIDLQNDAGKQP